MMTGIEPDRVTISYLLMRHQIPHLCCRNHTEEVISNSNGKPFIGYEDCRLFIEANDDHHNAESNSRQNVFFVSSSLDSNNAFYHGFTKCKIAQQCIELYNTPRV